MKNKQVNKIKLIYLMGMGRSGGTIMGRIVGQGESAFYVGELRYLWQRGVVDDSQCGCGASFSRCEIWSKVVRSCRATMGESLEKAIPIFESLNRTRAFPRIFFAKMFNIKNDKIDKYLDFESTLYQNLVGFTNKTTLVESSRYPGRAILLSMLENVEVYVVHLVRDSRGVVYSQLKEMERNGRHAPKYPFLRAYHWVAVNFLSSISKIVLGKGRYMFVRYEDFVEAPSDVIDSIFSFTAESLDATKSITNKTIELQSSHAFSGNRNRFDIGSVVIQRDLSWINGLSNITRRFITIFTYVPLKLYGYKISQKKIAS
ncbi:MAG: sulfotransferase [Gammaproteobacteria bacterium]|nr:sulfotransferase [Gammaproteobacteria bacterium]